jgi:hypothetical protein
MCCECVADLYLRLVVDELQDGKSAHLSGVCVCVCVCVFVYVCVCVCTHTHMHTHIHNTYIHTFYIPGNVMPWDILLAVDRHPVGSLSFYFYFIFILYHFLYTRKHEG